MSLNEDRNSFEAGGMPKQGFIEKMYSYHSLLFDYSEYLKKTGIEKIELTEDAVIFTERETHARFLCKRGDMRLPQIETLNFGAYEPGEAGMMMQLIRNGMTIFDVGANVGWFSIQFAKKHAAAKVYAFEPVANTFEWLENNCALNHVRNISLNNFGLGGENGSVEFFVYPEGSGGSSMADNSKRDSVKKVTCQIKRMDDFCEEMDVWPDFIKCDVEGAELFVFQGGEKVLSEKKPIVFTEMLRKWSASFGYHPNDIIQLFSNHGYQCFEIIGNKLARFFEMTENTVCTNFVFLHSRVHGEFIRSLTSDRED